MTLTFTDVDESFRVRGRNGVLHHRPARPTADAISLTRGTLVDLVTGERTLEAAQAEGLVSGETEALAALLSVLDRFDFWFEIVLP